MTLRVSFLLIAVIASLAFSSAARASGDEAWAQFAKDVSAKCLKAAGANVTKPAIVVDPYGSESFGLAVVSGKSGGVKVSYICVYDKKTGATELGSELEISVMKKPTQ